MISHLRKPTKHWAFDLDGTLVDSFPHYFILLADIFRKHGKTFSDDLRLPALTQFVPAFFEAHLGRPAVHSALAELQSRSNEDASEILPFDGIPAIIRMLAENGARIAVCTNRDRESTLLVLKHSGLEPYFELCVTGNCVSQRKPHPEGLSMILERFGCSAESLTMVGDHECDVLPAKAIGAQAVRASWHSYWPIEACSHADLQFRSVREFSAWIAG